MRNKENLLLVTGATGNVGRQVVSQLIGARVRALSRNPDLAGLPREVDVVRGDLSMPVALDECLADPGPKWLCVKTFPGWSPTDSSDISSVGVSFHPGNRAA